MKHMALMLLLVPAPALAQTNSTEKAACTNGDLAACQRGIAAARTILDAKAHFFFGTKACKLGDAAACAEMGDFHRKGIGTKQNYRKAMANSTAACNAGNAMGCLQVGFLHNEGQATARSTSKARAFYAKACDLGLPDHLQMVC